MESVLTLRVSAKTKSQREKLAAATNRSKSFLASEALERYFELEAWQIKEIKQALKEELQARKNWSNHYPYIVPYRIKNGSIEILRLFHTPRAWPKHI